MPSKSSDSLKNDYKQLLQPARKFLFFFPARSTGSSCLHCSNTRGNCSHLKEIINAAAIASGQALPYRSLPTSSSSGGGFCFRISDTFTFLKPLTKGAYGQLFLVKHPPSQQLMVAKVISLAEAFVKNKEDCNEVLESYLRERKVLLSCCRHPNVIKLYYSFRSEYFIYQVSGNKQCSSSTH